jgi:hypothetical protein
MLQVFQLFQTYVASVSSKCCKNKSGVVHVAMGPTTIEASCMRVGSRGMERGAAASVESPRGGWRQGRRQSPPVHATGYGRKQ